MEIRLSKFKKYPTPDCPHVKDHPFQIIGVANSKFKFSYKIESNMDQDHKKMTENLVIKLKFQARTHTHTHSINRKLHAFLNAEGPFGTLATFSEAP